MPFALTNDPSQAEISEAINYLLANFGANLSVDPNNGQITGSSGIIIAYFYKYLSVKYADSFDGTVNFSNSPTNRGYYGLRNTDSSVESTNPADYIWYQATGGFGTTKFLFYQTGGGRQINFVIATTSPGTSYVQESGPAIDLDVVTNSTATGAAAAAQATANTALANAATADATANTALSTANNKLSKIGADVLQGPISLNTASTILVGTTTNGVAIGNTGIIGRKAGATTFSVANTGDAIFAGALDAASGTFAGSLSAATGTFSGSLSAATGSFAGSLSSATGTFSGSLSAATGTFSGSLSAATGTFAGSLSAATGSFTGNITGAANINITGSGIFGGATSSGGNTYAVVANSAYGAQGGIISYSTNAFTGAMAGYASGAAFGGYFDSSGSQAALACSRSGSGPALQVNGPMTITSSTLVTNLNAQYLNGNLASAFYVSGGALGTPSSGNLANCTFPTLNQNTTGNAATATYATSAGSASYASSAGSASYASSAGSATYADYLGGYIASDWARIFPTNSGVANAGGSGVNLLGSTSTGIAGAYVGTSGSGNIVTWTVQTSSPSDIRLKEEITNSDLGLDFVKQLRPVSYKLKADPKHQKGYGFIAQEVENIIGDKSSLVYHEPDWKVGDETGFKTIHYPSYIAVLTKAIQELTAKVEALETKLKA